MVLTGLFPRKNKLIGFSYKNEMIKKAGFAKFFDQTLDKAFIFIRKTVAIFLGGISSTSF